VPPQVSQNVPAENAKVLRRHSGCDVGAAADARYKNSVAPSDKAMRRISVTWFK
jgi:hypothetical protein